MPQFLEQLIEILDVEMGSETQRIGETAATRGADLLKAGYSISQVVHDYGDICQVITELAAETQAPMSVDEFRTLNRCLDDAISGAVTEYSRLREVWLTSEETERAGVFAHELRNRLSAATYAFTALQSGMVGVGGSTAAVVNRNLRSMKDLVDTALAEVRVDAGRSYPESIEVAELLDELGASASIDAEATGVKFTVATVEPGVECFADRAVLSAAVGNLIQNAFKYSRAAGRVPVVSLRAVVAVDRVYFEVEDECGGLPDADHEQLFLPYTQRGVNRKGLGLGLYTSRRGIEATGGHLTVRDLPSRGCVFTIEVPRRAAA